MDSSYLDEFRIAAGLPTEAERAAEAARNEAAEVQWKASREQRNAWREKFRHNVYTQIRTTRETLKIIFEEKKLVVQIEMEASYADERSSLILEKIKLRVVGNSAAARSAKLSGVAQLGLEFILMPDGKVRLIEFNVADADKPPLEIPIDNYDDEAVRQAFLTLAPSLKDL